MTKQKKYLLLSFIVLFLALNSASALALEAKYWPLPGLPIITDQTKLPEFVIYWFGLGIYVAGTLALISLVIGAIGVIGAGAIGNPSAKTESMDRIKGSILGLVLVMASFIILKTINPVLTMPTLTPLGNLPGVYYTNGANVNDGEKKPCPVSEADTSNIPAGFNKIVYTCTNPGPDLFLWVYPKTNFSDEPLFPNTIVHRIECNQLPLTLPAGGSFKMVYATLGIYYFLGDNCEGYMSEANTASQNEIAEPFKGKIRSVWIMNDLVNKFYFGAIFHKEIGLQNAGLCSQPLPASANNCQPVNPNLAASAVDIYLINAETPLTSGNGAVFYTRPFGWSSGARDEGEGVYVIGGDEIISPYLNKDTATMTFPEPLSSIPLKHYFTLGTPEPYKKIDGRDLTFKDRPGSMEIKGKYLVALYSEFNCQTFYQSIANLNTQPLIPAGSQNQKIDNIVIVPLK